MKKLILTIVLVLAINFVVAEGEITLEEFDGNPDDFSFLSSSDQITYIKQIVVFTDENVQIAYDYFMDSSNIVTAPVVFENYMEYKGISITIDPGVSSQLFNYEQEGVLRGTAGQEINVYDFSDADEKIKIDSSGNIFIIDTAEKEWDFKGTLSAKVMPYGFTDFSLEEGEIAGKKVQLATFSFKEGTIRGEAMGFAGVRFDRQTIFQFDQELEELTLSKSTIAGMDEDLSLTIKGKDINLPNKDMIRKGSLTFKDGKPVLVGSSSDVSVDGFTHVTKKDTTLQLLYIENVELDKLNEREKKDLAKFSQLDEFDKVFGETSAKFASSKKKQKELEIKLKHLNERRAGYTEISAVETELFSVISEVNSAGRALRELTQESLPFIIEREDINLRYRQKREKLYEKLVPSMRPEGNHFISGKDYVLASGNGFTTKLEDDNPVFPEFQLVYEDWKTQKREGRFEFTMDGGEIILQRESETNRPLALSAKASGNVEILDGKWHLKTDGEDIIGKASESKDTALVASDLRILYTTDSGEEKTYDLGVDTSYYPALTFEEREDLLQEKKRLTTEIEKLTTLIKPIEEDALSLRSKRSEYTDLLYGGTKQVAMGLRTQSRILLGDLRRAEQRGTPEEAEQIKKEYQEVQEKIKAVYLELNKIESDPRFLEYIGLSRELNSKSYHLKRIESDLTVDIGERKTGVFGQVISSEDGNARLSYSEYLEGFPVMKKSDIYQYTREWFDRESHVTVGGQLLEVPEIVYFNQDKLALGIISKKQECIDTQFRLAYEYARVTGRDICYDKGATCLSDYPGRGRVFISDWMSKSTRTYEALVEGIEKGRSWEQDIEIIPPERYDGVQPGDVILRGGHAQAIKEVLEIDGRPYVRIFEGSQPAIDAHILDHVISIDELRETEDIFSIYRWKFRGRGKTKEKIDEIYKLSTGTVAGQT